MMPHDADPYSLSSVLVRAKAAIWDARRWLAVGGVLLSAALVVTVLLLPNRYTAEATLLPPSGSSTDFGLLRQVVGMAGLTRMGSVESYLQLYPVVARSRVVVEEIFDSDFQGRSVARIIGDVEESYEPTDEERERWLRALQDGLETEADLRTGYFRIGFTSTEPQFAAYVVNRVLERMDAYFSSVVRGDASRRRSMLEHRLDDISDSLRTAETALETFRIANQISSDSPKLAMREMRLVRDVEVNGAVYVELRKQLEIVAVEEQSSASVMNILDRAQVPQIKSGPPRARYCVAGFVIGELLILVSYLWFRRFRAGVKGLGKAG